MSDADIVNFLYEMGQLKRSKRGGWSLLGIPHPESIADHSWRTAIVAFLLAKLEGADPVKCAMISLFHELGETRITDLDKLSQRYLTQKEEAESRAFEEQMSRLPKELSAEIRDLYAGHNKDGSKEVIVAKDADYLECFLQAREYEDQGYKGARNWYMNAMQCLKTESAKRLAKVMLEVPSTDWYEALKRIER